PPDEHPAEPVTEISMRAPSDVGRQPAPPRKVEDVTEADLADLGLEPPESTSDIDLTEEVFEAGTSDVNLDSDRGPASPPGRGQAGPAARETAEGKPPAARPAADAGHPDIAPEVSGSTVNLGAAPTKGERPSGRDRIAEGLESGVDLDLVGEEGPSSGGRS